MIRSSVRSACDPKPRHARTLPSAYVCLPVFDWRCEGSRANRVPGPDCCFDPEGSESIDCHSDPSDCSVPKRGRHDTLDNTVWLRSGREGQFSPSLVDQKEPQTHETRQVASMSFARIQGRICQHWLEAFSTL